MKRPHRLALAGLVLALAALAGRGQERSVRPGINNPFENPDVKEFVDKFETESIEHIEKTSREQGLKNVVGVVCTPPSMGLPERSTASRARAPSGCSTTSEPGRRCSPG